MAVYEKKMDFMIKMTTKIFDLLERAMLGKRFFQLIIKMLNMLHLNYVTKYLDLNMLETLKL